MALVIGGLLAKGARSGAIVLTGAALDSGFQAFDTLSAAGINPNGLATSVLADIAVGALVESNFSYNSDTNILSGTYQQQDESGNLTELTFGIEIK